MGFTDDQLEQVTQGQTNAAHAPGQVIRLIAGPGTGKSQTIGERVRWLVGDGVDPSRIWVVSFTRASARDLQERLNKVAAKHDLPSMADVRATTLHSLGLSLLKRAGLLEDFAQEPTVLSKSECEAIHDAEFGEEASMGKTRVREVRAFFEAYWSTGREDAPTYEPPRKDAVSQAERERFEQFHRPTCRVYSYMMQGEILRRCVEAITQGEIDLTTHLPIAHLIVDEYQDLCPVDIEFVDLVARSGVKVFVAGDDDQSIYSFRHSAPSGIQMIGERFGEGAVTFLELDAHLRCGSNILDAALSLLNNYPGANRVEKHLHSLYAQSDPPVTGTVMRLRFGRSVDEAENVAASCAQLLQAGFSPNDILILLSSSNENGAVWPPIKEALDRAQVPYVDPNEKAFADSAEGSLLRNLLRIVCERDEEDRPKNIVAHRLLLGLQDGCGPSTCCKVREFVRRTQHLRYLDLFYRDVAPDVGDARSNRFIARCRTIVQRLKDWDATDTIEQRKVELCEYVTEHLTQNHSDACLEFMETFPGGMRLDELLSYMSLDNDEARHKKLVGVRERLGLPEPEVPQFEPKVRVLTMHGAKGLTAKIAFIPGLERGLLPNNRHLGSESDTAEAARLLYVSMTRAQVACIMSCASSRSVQGRNVTVGHSPFLPRTGGPITNRQNIGFTDAELDLIWQDAGNLQP